MIAGLKESRPSPPWMESLEIIHRTAEKARKGLPLLLQRSGGHAVTLSSTGDLVQDLMGHTYMWFEGQQTVGSVVPKTIDCRINREGAGDLEDMRFRILRKAKRAEVKSLWAKSPVSPKASLPSGGYWYEVHTD